MTSHAAVFTQKASVLSGKFRGSGTAYHQGKQVPYTEECSFTVARKNPKMVIYRLHQDTRHAIQGTPMHLEVGVLKVLNSEDSNKHDVLEAEAGITHPFPKGTVNELSKGTLDTSKSTLTLTSTGFQRTNELSDKHVTAIRRVYRREGRSLSYDQYLRISDEDFTHHLHCELELVE